MNDHNNTPYLTFHEASDYFRLAKRTLDNMRWMGTGQCSGNTASGFSKTLMKSRSDHDLSPNYDPVLSRVSAS